MGQKNQLTTSDHLEYPEFERLLKALHHDKEYVWELYARLAFCTACRGGDILHFKWLDVLDKEETTVIEQKTGKARRVNFNLSVRNSIHKLWELLDTPNRNEFIFKSNKQRNCLMTIQHVNRQLKEFRAKYNLKIEHFSTHTFRKTFGRYVYDRAPNKAEALILLNKILNHSSLQITKNYIGITSEEIRRIYDSIAF